MKSNSIVRENQQPLMEAYAGDPKAAWITDIAVIDGINLDDPFHTTVAINEELKTPFRVGVHRAVGGLHDFPNPGDMLCASLASCFESTLRLIADRLGIPLIETRVKATANVDVRGTLMVDRNVPVGFQNMDMFIELKTDDSVNKDMIGKLLKGTEKCCIIYQTIAKGIPVSIHATVLNN